MLATDARISTPRGIFVSPNNEVYFADYFNHKVRKILENGQIVTIAGTGTYGFSGDNGPATSAQLYFPSSVFVSSYNEVYIVDTANHRIRKILENGIIVTVAGNEQGSGGDNGLAVDAQLNYPTDVFVSPCNEVYIVDSFNHKIRKILQNGIIVTIAGNGKVGFSGDNQLAINSSLNHPNSVSVSSNGEVYISDTINNRIRKILQNGRMVTIAGNGDYSFYGDDIPATIASLNPSGIFVSPISNEIYFADANNHRIRKISKNGNISTIAGNGETECSDNHVIATNSCVNLPGNVFVSSRNEIYISETGHHRIRKILQNGTIQTIAGNGKCGISKDSPFDIKLYPHIGYSRFYFYKTLFTTRSDKLSDMSFHFHEF